MIYIYSLYYSVICCVVIGYLLSFVPNNIDLAQYKQIIIPEDNKKDLEEMAKVIEFRKQNMELLKDNKKLKKVMK